MILRRSSDRGDRHRNEGAASPLLILLCCRQAREWARTSLSAASATAQQARSARLAHGKRAACGLRVHARPEQAQGGWPAYQHAASSEGLLTRVTGGRSGCPPVGSGRAEQLNRPRAEHGVCRARTRARSKRDRRAWLEQNACLGALTIRVEASGRQPVIRRWTHATGVSHSTISNTSGGFCQHRDDLFRPNAAVQIWIVSADAGVKFQVARRGIKNPARQPPQHAHGA